MLWPCDRDELSDSYGGELDSALKMPGWTNVWTMPIQNRVDMLNTGVNTEIGVRVLGRRQEDVVRVSEEIAAVLRDVPGAAGVSADPIRGKGYLEIRPDREKAARYGVSIGDINDVSKRPLAERSPRRRSRGANGTPCACVTRATGAATKKRSGGCPSPPANVAEPSTESGRRRRSLTTGPAAVAALPRHRRGSSCRSKTWRRSTSSKARRRSRARTDCCEITCGSTCAAAA